MRARTSGAFYKPYHLVPDKGGLRTYCEIPDDIDLKLMDKPDKSTLGGEHNAVFFTQEQLAAGLRFLMPALVK